MQEFYRTFGKGAALQNVHSDKSEAHLYMSWETSSVFWWPVYHKISRIFVVYVDVSCSNPNPAPIGRINSFLLTRLKRVLAHPKLLCLCLVTFFVKI